ncbi:MAG: metal ABC transporter ATP-binding protein, partial [Bacillota bacterium]
MTESLIFAIEAENISATYQGKTPILKNINLQLPCGKFITIIGPNGAGKSTLIYLLSGRKKPLTGTLKIFGDSVTSQCKKQNIAYIPQNKNIDYDYPIRVQDIVLGGRYGHMVQSGFLRRFLPPGWAGRKHHRAVKKALQSVNMTEHSLQPLGELSGGQKKRVFLARALAQKAQLLLLDEPLTGIDEQSANLILELLYNLKEEGKTIIMVSHALEKIKKISEIVILLN